MHNTAMFDQPACPPRARSSSKSSPGRSKTSNPAVLAAVPAAAATAATEGGVARCRDRWGAEASKLVATFASKLEAVWAAEAAEEA